MSRRRSAWIGRALCMAAALAVATSAAALDIVDDSGRRFRFDRPPTRVVTLAPSLTELVFAAGAGSTIVGTTALSDYPEAARQIPRVGDAGRLDVERVLAMKPDLVLIWHRGATSRELAQLAAAGIRLFHLEPRRLDEVAGAIVRLGELLGHAAEARSRSDELRARLADLRSRYAAAAPVRVFYQVWHRPLMTINGQQLVSDVIALCGGRNVFAGLGPLVPVLSTESVVAADPEVILTASEEGGDAPAVRRRTADASFALWRRHPTLTAVRRGWLFTLNGDLISRQGPRIAGGAAAVCAALDDVRRERGR